MLLKNYREISLGKSDFSFGGSSFSARARVQAREDRNKCIDEIHGILILVWVSIGPG